MKRFLSIILCAALVIGMIPTAFANTTEESNTLEYVISMQAAGETARVGFDSTKHTYETVAAITGDGKSPNKWAYVDITGKGGASLETRSFHYVPYGSYCSEGSNGIAFRINVPEGQAGTYMPEISYFEHANGGMMSVYILPGAAPESWTSVSKDAISDYKKNPSTTSVIKVVDAKDTYGTEDAISHAEYKADKIKYVSGSQSVELPEGDSYVIFAVVGYREGVSGAGKNNSYYIHPSTITFTKLTPASVEVSADATELDAGGSTKLTSVVKTADGTEIPAKVNYSSSNANVTVDAEGNVTAGSVPGTAIITATVDGTTISDTITIKVTKSYNYAFYGETLTGDWNLEGASYGLVSVAVKKSWLYIANQINSEGDHNTNTAVFKIRFEEKGKYVPTLTVNPYVGGGIVSAYLLPATWVESRNSFGDDGILNVNTEALDLIGIAKTTNKFIGSADTYSEATSATAANKVPYTFDETEITEDEYYLLFSITGNNPNATAYVTKYTGFYAYISSLSFKKVGEVQNVESPTVALAVAYDDGDPTVTSYPRGKKITLTAPEISGKTFRHWVRGTADGGSWISDDETFEFTLATNTYLTAIYAENASETDKLVEFFGGNGEYITQAKADADGKVQFPADPKMTGFSFSRWIVAKDSPVTSDTVFNAPLTRVVAEFADSTATFEIEGEAFAYDTLIRREEDSEKAWYRDGELVGYGTTYNYHVWDSVGTIEARDISGAKKPVVVIDSTVKEDKACMIEYDTAGKVIAEVGIVFGTRNATIDSCNSKATSQKKLSHGQFTAKPNARGNASYARGYIIYNDAGVYRVTYTEAVALD